MRKENTPDDEPRLSPELARKFLVLNNRLTEAQADDYIKDGNYVAQSTVEEFNARAYAPKKIPLSKDEIYWFLHVLDTPAAFKPILRDIVDSRAFKEDKSVDLLVALTAAMRHANPAGNVDQLEDVLESNNTDKHGRKNLLDGVNAFIGECLKNGMLLVASPPHQPFYDSHSSAFGKKGKIAQGQVFFDKIVQAVRSDTLDKNQTPENKMQFSYAQSHRYILARDMYFQEGKNITYNTAKRKIAKNEIYWFFDTLCDENDIDPIAQTILDSREFKEDKSVDMLVALTTAMHRAKHHPIVCEQKLQGVLAADNAQVYGSEPLLGNIASKIDDYLAYGMTVTSNTDHQHYYDAIGATWGKESKIQNGQSIFDMIEKRVAEKMLKQGIKITYAENHRQALSRDCAFSSVPCYDALTPRL